MFWYGETIFQAVLGQSHLACVAQGHKASWASPGWPSYRRAAGVE